MKNPKKKRKHNLIFSKAIKALLSFLKQCEQRELEPVRVAHAGWALLFAGCDSNNFFKKTAKYLKQTQQDDGGWSDVEETVWSASFLAKINGENDPSVIFLLLCISNSFAKKGRNLHLICV